MQLFNLLQQLGLEPNVITYTAATRWSVKRESRVASEGLSALPSDAAAGFEPNGFNFSGKNRVGLAALLRDTAAGNLAQLITYSPVLRHAERARCQWGR